MSEEDRISHLREAEGFKARKSGEHLHEGASKDFEKGFSRVSVGFGSNVTPRNFGRTGQSSADWTCVCGNVNKGWVKYRLAGREVCGLCKQERTFVDTERVGEDDTGAGTEGS